MKDEVDHGIRVRVKATFENKTREELETLADEMMEWLIAEEQRNPAITDSTIGVDLSVPEFEIEVYALKSDEINSIVAAMGRLTRCVLKFGGKFNTDFLVGD
ncbi:MAG TPA: hypothetical protein VHK27_15295 [Gammaproteobacteria bacterium]|nr:hypothetical protein [Gammaproteobacteria bacterium]